MVRGLDYYTRTTFEVTTEFLGAQNAILGGGRYDHLVQDLGGPDISGIGFAIGLERLAALIPDRGKEGEEGPLLFIAALGERAVEKAFFLGNRLRMKGIRVEMDYTGTKPQEPDETGGQTEELLCPDHRRTGDR